MNRRSFQSDRARLAAALVISCALALVFAAQAHHSAGEAPQFAIRVDGGILNNSVSPTTPAPPLITVALRRPDTDALANALIGLLIWLPAFGAYATFALYVPRAVPALQERETASLVVASVGLGMVGGWNSWFIQGLMAAFAAIVILAITVRLSGRRKCPDTSVGGGWIVISLFLFAATNASATMHSICVEYRGFAPVLYLDEKAQDGLLGRIDRDLMSRPSLTTADVFDRIEQLPRLNQYVQWTPFGRNRAALIGTIGFGLISTLICAFHFHGGRRYKEQWPRSYIVAFAIVLYLSIGAAFGMMFYNEYISEAGRQNVLNVYARILNASESEYDRIRDQFDTFGWSEQLREIVRVRKYAGSPGLVGPTLQAAVAERWAVNVIAQEQPQVVLKDGLFKTESALVPSQTVLDMFYYSFASFTTTGYGDVRPVSDVARFWSILENIAELLFTAIFFTVALTTGRPTGLIRRSRTAGDKRRKLNGIGNLMLPVLVLFLVGCRSEGAIAPAPCPAALPAQEWHASVIIDDSKTMQAFFSSPTSEYQRAIMDLVQAMDTRVDVNYYRLSQLQSAMTDTDKNRLVTKDFYGADTTPLSTFFELAEKTDDSTTLVLVSDLDDSEPGGLGLLAKRIRAAVAEKKPYVALFPLTMHRVNEGTVWRRPLYVLFVAASWKQLEAMESTAKIGSLARLFSLQPNPAPEDVRMFQSRRFLTVTFFGRLSTSGSDAGWNDVLWRDSLACDGREVPLRLSSVEQVARRPSQLTYVVSAESDLPVADSEQIVATVKSRPSQRLGATVRREVPRLGDPTARRKATIFQVSYDASAQSIPSATYCVDFTPGSRNLGVPQWINNLATGVLRKEEKKGKQNDLMPSPGLARIVEAIIAASSEHAVFLQHCITIQRQAE